MTRRNKISSMYISAILIGSCFDTSVLAQDKEDEARPSSIERVEHTSFIWLESKEGHLTVEEDVKDETAKRLNLLSEALKSDEKILENDNFDGLPGFLLPYSVSEAQAWLVKKELSAKIAPYRIEPNRAVHLFESTCDDSALSYSTQQSPWGVLYVSGGALPGNYGGSSSAWIIDSGIADYSSELNVASRRDCTTANCPMEAGRKKDSVGHGTMIAEIIGAIKNTEGVVGVAPGAQLNSLRVVSGKQAITDLGWVLRAIRFVRLAAVNDADPTTPTPGDVVNLSLGTNWNYATISTQQKIETELQSLAMAGFKVAVAAGNIDTLGGIAYVQTISPARAGGYAPNGVVLTASAFKNGGDFWEFSAFGNYNQNTTGSQTPGPPDFAEPGHNILSLWPPRQELATCSGTSFAAAHLSGLLLWGMPREIGRVLKDPSATNPNNSADPLQDKIGGR